MNCELRAATAKQVWGPKVERGRESSIELVAERWRVGRAAYKLQDMCAADCVHCNQLRFCTLLPTTINGDSVKWICCHHLAASISAAEQLKTAPIERECFGRIRVSYCNRRLLSWSPTSEEWGAAESISRRKTKLVMRRIRIDDDFDSDSDSNFERKENQKSTFQNSSSLCFSYCFLRRQASFKRGRYFLAFEEKLFCISRRRKFKVL